MFGCLMIYSGSRDGPNIKVMCMVKFQYATSVWLALSHDHCLVSLLLPDVPITVVSTSTAIPTFNYFLNAFILN